MKPFLLFLALVALLLQCTYATPGFQSDELNEDEEEWGLVGTAPPTTLPTAASKSTSTSTSRAEIGTDGNKVEFVLEHAFGGSDFSPAGTFTARLRPSSRGGQTLVKIRLTRNKLSAAEQAAFKELIQKDGFYTIRLPATPLNPGDAYVMSSTKARCLAAANLKDRFDIYLEQGNIIAVGYNADADCTYPRVVRNPSKWYFDTHIVSKGGEQAARMLLLNEVEAAPGESLGDEDLVVKKPVPEKSFWAKYWMYIVPMGLIVMNALTQILNMQEEPPAQGGGGQGQVAGRPANAVAPVRRR